MAAISASCFRIVTPPCSVQLAPPLNPIDLSGSSPAKFSLYSKLRRDSACEPNQQLSLSWSPPETISGSQSRVRHMSAVVSNERIGRDCRSVRAERYCLWTTSSAVSDRSNHYFPQNRYRPRHRLAESSATGCRSVPPGNVTLNSMEWAVPAMAGFPGTGHVHGCSPRFSGIPSPEGRPQDFRQSGRTQERHDSYCADNRAGSHLSD